MSTTTANLGLFKYNTSTDANTSFSIDTALNNNWDKIDSNCMQKVSAAGGTAQPVYINSSGEIKALSGTVGSTVKPVYLSSGEIKALSDTIGSTTKPVYLNSGTITALSGTVGSTVKPVYMNAGDITALSGTVGSTIKPVYLNEGAVTALSSTVGTTLTPVYLNAGTITKCSSSMVTATISKAANGYTKFSNNFMIQWGSSTQTAAAEVSITLPTAYSSTYRINATGTTNMSSNIVHIAITSTSKFTVYYSKGVHWITCGW